MRFTGCIVVVTGASRGIGRAISLAFAKEGACVVATGRDADLLGALEATLRALTPESWTKATDLTEPGACEALITAVVARHGRIDHLVNNAGIASAVPIEDLTTEAWRQMMAINVEVPMRLTRDALAVMRRQQAGRVINIASDAALRGIGRMSMYCASKHALLGFGRAANEELRGTPVRVTTVCPGPVTTTIMGTGNPDAMAPEDVAEAVLAAAALSERSYVAEVLLRPTRLS